MEVTLLGYAGEAVRNGGTVVLAFETSQPPVVADFLLLPERTVCYVAYLAAKQWWGVAAELQKAENALL